MPPRPPERVRDEDGRGDAQRPRQSAADPASRAVRVLRQKDDGPIRGSVGRVDPGVRADETVVRHADHDPVLGAEHIARFVEYDLHVARVLAEFAGELLRSGARRHLGQPAKTALRLGHGLVGDHDHVTVRQRRAVVAQRGCDEAREVVAGLDLRQSAKRDGGDQISLRMSWRIMPRVCAAPPCVESSPSRRASRSSGVSTSSASEGTSTTSGVVPADSALAA